MIINKQKNIVKAWVNSWEDIDKGAIEQINHLANLPFIYNHIAVMPDVHSGYGVPIGSVLVTKDVIIPNAVGVDIGCGMVALDTEIDINEISTEQLKDILGEIRNQIPVGFNRNSEPISEGLMPFSYGSGTDLNGVPICKREYQSSRYQLGTLGGGNHFIELQKGSNNTLWVMIHSGSRNLGKQVAEHYNKVAKELNEKYFSSIPKEWDLAFLPLGSEESNLYLNEMGYCISFASNNRYIMMKKICEIISYKMNTYIEGPVKESIHNFAVEERGYEKGVIIHRKGATPACKDSECIIPGSQGTKSYICKGLGNPESFNSCSHGSGRLMGRNEARKTLNLEEEIKKLDSKGIIHEIRTEKDLDESPSAYKDIDIVMENQKDLVTPIVELIPLAVIKG
jgi:tRNA-splicing ligase RtcB